MLKEEDLWRSRTDVCPSCICMVEMGRVEEEEVVVDQREALELSERTVPKKGALIQSSDGEKGRKRRAEYVTTHALWGPDQPLSGCHTSGGVITCSGEVQTVQVFTLHQFFSLDKDHFSPKPPVISECDKIHYIYNPGESQKYSEEALTHFDPSG